MSLHINLIAPKGRYGFGYLVADALRKAGVFIHWWDYRRERNPWQILDKAAPTLTLRGEHKENIAQVLDSLDGQKFLWYAEDVARDDGRELLELCAYYQNIWLHWDNAKVINAIGNIYSNKRVEVVPVLYADTSIWTPERAPELNENAYHCEVLHYGCLTPRREKTLADLRRYCLADGTPLVVYQVEDSDHARVAEMVRRAKVIINLHAWSDMNLEVRLAEALSCGAFVVTETLPPGINDDLRKAVVEVASGSIKGMFDCCRLISQEWFYEFKQQRLVDMAAYAAKEFSHLHIVDTIGPLIYGERDWIEHTQGLSSNRETA